MNAKRISIIGTVLVMLLIAACGVVLPAEIISLEEPTAPTEDSLPQVDEVVEEELPELGPDASLTTGSQVVITRENAGDLTQIDYIGKGSINNMAWSPLGSPIALATTTGIYLIDAQTYQEDHFSKTTSDHVAFSPDGALLASAEGSRVILRDAHSGSEHLALEGHADQVYHIAFSPVENLLATASQDETVKLWDLDSGEELKTLKGTGTFVYYVAFSPDGKTLISVAYDQQIILWDVESGAALPVDSEISGSTLAVALVGETIAVGGYDDPLRIVDFNGQVRLTLDEEPKPVRDLTFSPDGKILASATSMPQDIGMNTTLKLWDTASGELLYTLDDEGGYYAISFSPDGAQIATAALDKVTLWDAESGQEMTTITDQPDEKKGYGTGGVDDFAWSPDGKTLALATDGGVSLVNPQTQEEIKLTTHGYPPQNGHIITFSPDGNLLAVSLISVDETNEPHGNVIIYDVASGEPLFTIEDFEKDGIFWNTFGIAFSPDGKTLATGWGNPWGGGAGGIKIWDVFSGSLVSELGTGDRETIYNLAFSDDGDLLAGISGIGRVHLWYPIEETEVLTFSGTSGYGGAVAFSPDGSLLAVGGAASDGRNYDYEPAELHLFDSSSGDLILDLEGHQSLIRSLSFNADGSVLASASWDDTVRLWDVETGQQLAVLDIPGATSVGFSPDGTLLATAGYQDVVRLWGTPETAASFPQSLAGDNNTIPALAMGVDLGWGAWMDSQYYFYLQRDPMDEPDSNQIEITFNFLDTHTGEICTSLTDTLPLTFSGWMGYYIHLPSIFFMADQRLLYLSLDGELSAITPCGETIEDWTEILPESVTSIGPASRNGASQTLLVGESEIWLFTPGTGQSVKVDIPASYVDGETGFSWSPWEAKLVSSRLVEREDGIGIVLEDIDLTTGKPSLLLEFPIKNEDLSKDIHDASVNWLARDVLSFQYWLSNNKTGNENMKAYLIDLSDEPFEITDVFPDLFGMEVLSLDSAPDWRVIRMTDGQDYFFMVSEGLLPNGKFYLYSSETRLVETYPLDPPKLLVFPNGDIVFAEIFGEKYTSQRSYQVIQVGTDVEPYELQIRYQIPGHMSGGHVEMIPGKQALVISTDQGIALVDLEDGETLDFWVLENQTQYEDFHLDISPDGKKVIIYGIKSYETSNWPHESTTAIYYLHLDD
jgi:WD40 repeat protein